MASIPVRLSAQLATRAKQVASLQDRSLTEQVEHWARLGELVENAVSAATVQRLKAQSYDIEARLAHSQTPEGRAGVLALIESRNPVRYGVANGKIKKYTRKSKPAR
ncbi:MAG: TA system antitoxin ParD family protein [Kofleriaceae bacterium]